MNLELKQAVERNCSFNCDAESSCECIAHMAYRALLIRCCEICGAPIPVDEHIAVCGPCLIP